MRTVRIALLGALLTAAAAAPPAEVSERYGYRTYREIVSGVTLLADTTLAAPNPDASYVALAVAVGLAPGTPPATVSREGFSLVDAGGHRVAAAGAMEIRERHGRVAFDASLLRVQRMTLGQQFAGRVEIPSRFYGDSNGLGLVQDRVHLDPSTWFRDVVYFPRPARGLDGVLTLRVEGEGLAVPVEVRFRVIHDGW